MAQRGFCCGSGGGGDVAAGTRAAAGGGQAVLSMDILNRAQHARRGVPSPHGRRDRRLVHRALWAPQ
jgi:hypothetical protein